MIPLLLFYLIFLLTLVQAGSRRSCGYKAFLPCPPPYLSTIIVTVVNPPSRICTRTRMLVCTSFYLLGALSLVRQQWFGVGAFYAVQLGGCSSLTHAPHYIWDLVSST